MSQIVFYNFIFIIPIIISFYTIFKSYFIIFIFLENNKSYVKDFLKGRKKNSVKLINGYFSTVIFNSILIFIFYLYFFKSFENLLLNQHIFISNTNYSILMALFIISIIIQLFLENIINYKYKSLGSDYLLSIYNIILYSPIILLSNTIITLFFFLEISVSLTLYNFITTWSIVKIKLKGSNKTSTESKSRSFFNLIFFQFWSSFFSAALIIYGIINYYLIFGTTEWLYLNLLIMFNTNSINNISIVISTICIIVGFIIKLGLAPFFIYKLEIYKSLPLPTLLFYSIFYFMIFISIFLIFSAYFLNLNFILLKVLLLSILILILLIILLTFDSQSLRNFFAISSIITASNLIIVLNS